MSRGAGSAPLLSLHIPPSSGDEESEARCIAKYAAFYAASIRESRLPRCIFRQFGPLGGHSNAPHSVAGRCSSCGQRRERRRRCHSICNTQHGALRSGCLLHRITIGDYSASSCPPTSIGPGTPDGGFFGLSAGVVRWFSARLGMTDDTIVLTTGAPNAPAGQASHASNGTGVSRIASDYRRGPFSSACASNPATFIHPAAQMPNHRVSLDRHCA